MELLSQLKRLSEQTMFIVEKQKLVGVVISVQKHEDMARLFSVMPTDRTVINEHKRKITSGSHGTSERNTVSQCEAAQPLVQAAQAPSGVSTLGDIHTLFGHDTGEVEPVENRGWRGLSLKHSSSSCEGTVAEPFD